VFAERISDAQAALRTQFSLRPVVAGEIEFYLHGSSTGDVNAFWRDVETALTSKSISIFKCEQERGHEQWEIALAPRKDAHTAAADIITAKQLISHYARANNMGAEFAAKPLADQPGSGLHIHVHLEDFSGERVFYKKNDVISDALKWSLGGLLATMRDNMPVFAPTAASRARFVAGSNAPITLSWGANNRTCALRLPDINAPYRHIEHRVAGSDADPEAVIAVILEGIIYGLTHQCDPGAQVYGDASKEVYDLERLMA
jgi:glutamine synthetase